MTDVAVQVDGLQMRFGDTRALDGMDLSVRAGSVLGHDVVAEPLAVRRRIGLAGQFAAVDAELTARENLEMVGRLYRLPGAEARRRAAEVLDRLGLADVADRRVDTYSGGMRRRIDLGASLVGRPPLLLLDEPTTGLDPRSRQDLWAIVDELRRDGTTVLLTTQYLEEADRLAQHIAVLDHGRIVAHGTVAQLKAAVGGQTLSVQVADPATVAAATEALADLAARDAPALDAVTGEIRLTVASAGASADALRRLDQRGLAVASVTLAQPTLDDVFLTLTGRPAQSEVAATDAREAA